MLRTGLLSFAIVSLVACGKIAPETHGSASFEPDGRIDPPTNVTGPAAQVDAGASPTDFDVCSGDHYEFLANVTVTNVDYLEMRELSHGQAPIVTAVGNACATSTSHDACVAKVASIEPFLWPDESVSPTDSLRRSFVTTRGDDVRTLRDADEILTAIAPLDSPNDAALFLTLRRQGSIRCDGTTNAHRTATGWEVRMWQAPCGSNEDIELVFAVDFDGTIRTLSQTTHPGSYHGCG